MCGSMVDIQSPTAEIRRGKREEEDRNHRTKISWSALLHRATIIKLCAVLRTLWSPYSALPVRTGQARHYSTSQ